MGLTILVWSMVQVWVPAAGRGSCRWRQMLSPPGRWRMLPGPADCGWEDPGAAQGLV